MTFSGRFFLVQLLLPSVLAAASATYRHQDGHELDTVQIFPHGGLETHHTLVDEDVELIEASHGEKQGMPMVRSETHGPPKEHPNLEMWKRVTEDWIYHSIRHAGIWSTVVPAMMALAYRASKSMRPPLPMALAAVGTTTMAYLACDWSEKDKDEFAGKVVGGSFMGAVMAFGLLSFIAGVMCCGCCMDSVIEKTKPVGLGVAIGAFVAMNVPYGMAMMACGTVDDDICSSCVKSGQPPCDSVTRTAIQETCKTIALFIAYYLAFGWLTCIIAWAAFGMGCCLICGCCNCKVGEELIRRETKGRPTGQPVK